MRAFRVFGEGEARLVDLAEPEPGPTEVVIAVAGNGLCRSDLHMIDAPNSQWGGDLPFTLGHEVSGRVAKLGSQVVGLDEGDAVVVAPLWHGCGRCRSCRGGFENYCPNSPQFGAGYHRDGGLADFLRVPSARWLIPLGDLDPADCAPLADAGITSYSAVVPTLDALVPGSTAVVIGVGGVGGTAVQLLRTLSPARVVAIEANPGRFGFATRLGADVVVAPGDAAETVDALTANEGADAVYDFVGTTETMRSGISMLRPAGHFTLVGTDRGSIDFGLFSVPFGASLHTVTAGGTAALHAVADLALAGRLAVPTVRFPLDHVEEAYQALTNGEVEGRIVVTPE